jgi:hypothetical protein
MRGRSGTEQPQTRVESEITETGVVGVEELSDDEGLELEGEGVDDADRRERIEGSERATNISRIWNTT